MNLTVQNDSLLLDYLYLNIKDKSKNNIKSLLKNSVFVNGRQVNKFDYLLKKDDKIFICLKKINDINILYEDDDLLIADKPYNLLTISTTKEKEKTLYHILLEYLKKKKQKIFVIHRLDKETSGIIMFAKNEKVKNLFQNNWEKYVLERKYIAIVDGKDLAPKGTLKSFLAENKNHKVYVTNEKEGKLAITNFKKKASSNKYSLVDIEILTGRKNQIRVQFADYGFPIVGDKKYGKTSFDRMCLHALSLTFIHPIKQVKMNISAPIPNEFYKLIKEIK